MAARKSALRAKSKPYRFLDKDPIIDTLRTAIADSKLSHREIALRANLTPQTIRNWLYGSTHRPMHYSVAAVMNALSYRETWRSTLEDRVIHAVFNVRKVA
jgi:transcriptional regulator with XRE-family HTH domain